MHSQRASWLCEPRGYNLMTADSAAGAAGVFLCISSPSLRLMSPKHFWPWVGLLEPLKKKNQSLTFPFFIMSFDIWNKNCVIIKLQFLLEIQNKSWSHKNQKEHVTLRYFYVPHWSIVCSALPSALVQVGKVSLNPASEQPVSGEWYWNYLLFFFLFLFFCSVTVQQSMQTQI